MRVSVIIPTLNEAGVLGQCLRSLVQQGIPSGAFEVILVDNGSTDRTVEIACEFQGSLNLTVLQKRDVHISALRNHGAVAAKGDYLAFLDADCIAPPDWLGRAIDQLQLERCGVVGAHYTIPAASSWVARTWYGDMRTLKRGPVSYVPAGSLLVSRKVFFEVGGFDETIETSEDCEFCQRVTASGWPVVAVPSLSVVHLGTPQTVAAFYRKQRWHGKDVHTLFLRRMLRSSGAKPTLFALYTLCCLLAAALGAPIALFSGNYAALLVPALLLLILPFLLAIRATVLRRKWRALVPLTFLYFIYGLARGLCLLGIRSPRRDQATPAGRPNGALPAVGGAE
jgi:glycosyltransferase involved in cell wall biosynthesis